MNELELLIAAQRYGGWTEINVRRSVQCLAGEFELTVAARWNGQIAAKAIRTGAACSVRIDGKTVITGYIDDVEPDYDERERRLTVRGRDKTADLVDCSAIYQGGAWTDVTLADIARNLCAPFGVPVIVQTDVGDKFAVWQIQAGEPVIANLQRAARQRGVLLTSNAQGALVITRASKQRIATRLQLGVNIVRGRGASSLRERYSEYQVLGQQAFGAGVGFGDAATEPMGKAKDAAVPRYRPLLVVAEDQVTPASAATRATWERNRRAGESRQVEYSLRGWSHADGLWEPDRCVSVHDDELDIDGTLYITEVRYRLDDRGFRTELQLTLPQAMDLIALPDPALEPGQ